MADIGNAVSGAQLRERFRSAFSLKPDMTTKEFYNILQSTGFDEEKTLFRVWELAGKPEFYHVPREIMGRPIVQLPPTRHTTLDESSQMSHKQGHINSLLSPSILPMTRRITAVHTSRPASLEYLSNAPDIPELDSPASPTPSSSDASMASTQRPDFDAIRERPMPPEMDSPTSPVPSAPESMVDSSSKQTGTQRVPIILPDDEDDDDKDVIDSRHRRVPATTFAKSRQGFNIECWQSEVQPGLPFYEEQLECAPHPPDALSVLRRFPTDIQQSFKGTRRQTEIRQPWLSENDTDVSEDEAEDIHDSDEMTDIHEIRVARRQFTGAGLDLKSNSRVTSSKIEEKSRQVKQNPPPKGNTIVTNWIGRLAGSLFVRNLLVCGAIHNDETKSGLQEVAEAENTTVQVLIDMTVDPEENRRAGWTGRKVTEKITLTGRLWEDTKGCGKVGYASALVDDVVLVPGDYVTVRPGQDEHPLAGKNRKKATSSDPSPSASIWFARIVYIFQDGNGILMAHMRWLAHGGDTILAETAGPRELFLLSRCDDVPLGAIAGKIKVDYRGREGGCSGIGVIEEAYHKVNHYFYRQHYSEADETFEEARLHEKLSGLPNVRGSLYCDCCESRKREEKRASTSLLGEKRADGTISAIMHGGVAYHLHDFVYVTPKSEKSADEPYIIGQITSIDVSSVRQWLSMNHDKAPVQISVQTFERYDNLLKPYVQEVDSEHVGSRDNRRLYRTMSSITIPQDRLDGKCFVRHVDLIDDLNAFKDMEDTFYVTHKMKATATRRPCLADLEVLDSIHFIKSLDEEDYLTTFMRQQSAFLATGQKLQAMDVFAGAGLLSAGLEMSGAVETKWAIECDVFAAATFKRNNPDAYVYCFDANRVLYQAFEENQGTDIQALRDEHGNQLPRLPGPGEVFIICGGPPCQDFTKCNRYQKAKSSKNSLVTTYLSYVDHFKPKYFLLENVQDLVDHRLGSSQVNQHKTEGGIEMGAAKFILRALTSMGYQCQYAVLQAGEHGTPQSRHRVFFWGCLPGYRLPKYPEPSHIFTGTGIRKSKYARVSRRSAPHNAVSVGDAITDLPAFDWNMEVREELDASKEARKRRGRVIRQISLAGNEGRIGQDSQHYASKLPLSEYQRKCRWRTTGNIVYNHYTMRWKHDIMERVIRIPMLPGANHNDIPEKWDLQCLRKTDSAKRHKCYPSRYKRLPYDGKFQTCLTDINPSGDNGHILHPSQYRVLTVREQARAMGVPDSFTWDHETQPPKAMYHQLGNGVAIPVGRALGRELLKVLVTQWAEEQAVKSPDDIRHSIEYHEDDVDMNKDIEDDVDDNISVAARLRNSCVVEVEDENGDVWMQIVD